MRAEDIGEKSGTEYLHAEGARPNNTLTFVRALGRFPEQTTTESQATGNIEIRDIILSIADLSRTTASMQGGCDNLTELSAVSRGRKLLAVSPTEFSPHGREEARMERPYASPEIRNSSGL